MSSVPPPSQSGVPSGNNNGIYIALALLLLLGVGGIVAYKLKGGTTETPKPLPTATVTASTSATNALIDDVPPPPPVIDAGPAPTVVYTGGPAADPCTYNVCNGNVVAGGDTERGLQALALRTRRKCYDPALANDPTLQGHVKVHMKIASNGQICSANVANNDMSNTSVGECAARMLLSSGHVPPPKGGCVNLDFPLNYVPMGQH